MNKNSKVAYFSMEIGVNSDIKTYSGGLGVLAGDMLKSAEDINYPMTGVTLLYREGYLNQELDREQGQIEHNDKWDYEDKLQELVNQFHIQIRGEDVKVKLWKHDIGDNVDIIFLDTNIEGNSEFAKNLTRQLYSSGRDTRLAQEALLGIGGLRALQEAGKNPSVYHMNEGHSALLTTELYRQKRNQGKSIEKALKEVQKNFVFTTHTPVAAGHDKFDEQLVNEIIPSHKKHLEEQGFQDLNTTELALQNSYYTNAVSNKHEEVSEEMFPETEIESIVNGIHSQTWTNEHLQEKLDEKLPLWRQDSRRLTQAEKLTDEEIWETHQKSKKDLIDYINRKKDTELKEDVLTLGFARRATSYKRMDLLFKNLDKLETLAEEYNGLQIVIAGKAHPDDTQGKELIKKVLNYTEILEKTDAVFLENYEIDLGKKLTSGVDVWVNTPVRGKEASGTSGMKAAHNCVPQLSILDGWWIEGHIEGKTGWSIGENYVEGKNQNEVDAKSIYQKLETILQKYHHDREEWIQTMRTSLTVNAPYFNTQRMIEDYISQAYSQKPTE